MKERKSRFEWAADIMDLSPKDQILEVGCGAGLAIPSLTSRLKTGKIVAIDSSASMVAKAVKNNESLIRAQVVSVHTSALHAFKTNLTFDKILCFNINFFWTKKDLRQGMDAIRKRMSPKSRLYIFYGPMLPGSTNKTIDPIEANLEENGFKVAAVHQEKTLNCYGFVAVLQGR